MKNLLRILAGTFFALGALGGVISFARDHKPEEAIMTIVLAVISFLLLRKKKRAAAAVEEPVTVSFAPQQVPENILRDMRKYYTPMQAENDARIMADSYRLIQETVNFDTFFSRLELAQQKALTLLQAEQAGCKGLKKMRVNPACESVLATVPKIKAAFLDRTYIKETNDAMLLKTPSGQRKRLAAYLKKLQEHEMDFLDVADAYEETVKKTQTLMS